jgi:aldehyde:ferredoxin oxidoreductase
MEYLSNGKILVVNLESKTTEELELDEELIQANLGGAGVNAYLLREYKESEPVVLGTGLLTGTLCPGSSLGVMSSYREGTDELCHIPLSLRVPAEIKYSGFDFIVILGRADSPCYLWIHDGIADLKDANPLWGKDVWETTDFLRKELGDNLIQTVVIGPGGESLSPYAGICLNYWNALDSLTLGHVLGSKKLKAIALRGMGLLEIKEPESFIESCNTLLKEWKAQWDELPQGLTGIYKLLNKGDVGTWLSPIVHRHRASFNTPIAGSTFVFIEENPMSVKETQQEEPGVLLTQYLPPLLLKERGLDPKEAASFLRGCARMGLEPVRLIRAGIFHFPQGGLKDLPPLEEEKGNRGLSCANIPQQPLWPNAPMPKEEWPKWWERMLGFSYIFGLDPIFMLTLRPERYEVILKLVQLGSGIEVGLPKVDEVLEGITKG